MEFHKINVRFITWTPQEALYIHFDIVKTKNAESNCAPSGMWKSTKLISDSSSAPQEALCIQFDIVKTKNAESNCAPCGMWNFTKRISDSSSSAARTPIYQL